MNLTRVYLLAKREEYFDAYMDALATANANHGAMQAMEELLARLEREELQKLDATDPERLDAVEV